MRPLGVCRDTQVAFGSLYYHGSYSIKCFLQIASRALASMHSIATGPLDWSTCMQMPEFDLNAKIMLGCSDARECPTPAAKSDVRSETVERAAERLLHQ